MSIFSSGIAPDRKRWQLVFHNDNTFEFRRVDVQDGSLVLLEHETIKQAWPALNKLRLPFAGMGNIKKTNIIVCIDNDIIWDPFNKLTIEDKPEAGPELVKDWVKRKADNTRYRYQSKPPVSPFLNKIIMFSGIACIGVFLLYGITLMVTLL